MEAKRRVLGRWAVELQRSGSDGPDIVMHLAALINVRAERLLRRALRRDSKILSRSVDV
jgi:hypothetical protein